VHRDLVAGEPCDLGGGPVAFGNAQELLATMVSHV
jgi:hypothetical protein